MEKKDEKIEAGKKRFRQEAIKWFLFITLCIGTAEFFINLLIQKVIAPYLDTALQWGDLKQGTTIVGPLLFVARLLFFNIFQVIILPLPQVTQQSVHLWMQNNIAEGLAEPISLYTLRNIGILLVILFVILYPYVYGAQIYIRILSKKMDVVLEMQKKSRIEFEQKRSLMLSDIAHDLKTPMTTVSGYSQALLDGMVEENKKKEYLTAICKKTNQMNQLVVLLFEYVKLDSAGFVLKKEKTDVAELLRENVAQMYSDFEENEMELRLQIPEEKVYFMLDRLQFQRAITNVLTNMIRHNKRGTIVQIVLKPMKYSSNWILMLGDSGQAIDPNIAERIFEPFVVGDASRTSNGGSGLGMSIAHKIMEMHGFEFVLHNKQEGDMGKTFYVILKDFSTNYDNYL